MDIIKEIDPIYIVIMIFLLCAIIFVIIALKSKGNGGVKFRVYKSWDPSTWRIRWGAGIDEFDIGGEGKPIDEIGKVDRTKDVGKY